MRAVLISNSLFTWLFLVASSNGGLPITTMAPNQPSDQSPTTAPVSPVSVMLVPFHAVGAGGEDGWIAEAINEDLAHDLSRNSAIHVIRASATQPAADGLTSARDAKADRLITGSYQVVDDQLRVTAEVVDVNQTQPVGQIKATGRVRDLFELEDSLATQLWHILPQGSSPDFQVSSLEDYEATHPAPQAPVYDPPQSPEAPAYNSAPEYAPYSDAGFDSAYPYGGYGFGYPYGFGFPLFLGVGRGYHGYHGGTGHWIGGTGRGNVSSHAATPQVLSGSPHTMSAPGAFGGGGGHMGAGGHR